MFSQTEQFSSKFLSHLPLILKEQTNIFFFTTNLDANSNKSIYPTASEHTSCGDKFLSTDSVRSILTLGWARRGKATLGSI